MPTPQYGYFKDGKKIPSVTTILKQEDQSGLVAAANLLGLKGRAIYGPQGEWSKAADVGTAVHAMIQSFIEGLTVEYSAAAVPAFKSFLEWAGHRLWLGRCEVALVHTVQDYGGTIDYLDGEGRFIMDWKTSKSFEYSEKFYGQMAGYSMLAESHGMTIDRCTIVRFPKEGGKAEELVIETGSPKERAGRELFRYLLAAYEARQIISAKEEEPPKPQRLGLIAR